MGRPKELTDEQRADLEARGFVPVEIWVPNWDDPAFAMRLREHASEVCESDRRSGMNETLDAFAKDLWNDLD